jgi:hypothetical protein
MTTSMVLFVPCFDAMPDSSLIRDNPVYLVLTPIQLIGWRFAVHDAICVSSTGEEGTIHGTFLVP